MILERHRRPELQAFAETVSIIDGMPVRDFGVMFTTRMTVVKLSDGSLWVNSPVSVPFDTLGNASLNRGLSDTLLQRHRGRTAAGRVAHAIS